jgi:hypothetical protein
MNAPTGSEKLTIAIMPNDVVKHRPSGRNWTVCGVNYRRNELIPDGYRFPHIARISDCELVEKRYDMNCQSAEQIKALQAAEKSDFIDVDSAMYFGII